MPAEELNRWLREVPFQPFRMYVLEALRVEIRHPELCLVKLASIDVYEMAGAPGSPEFRRQMTVSLRHVTRLEVLPTAAPATGNGSGG